MLKKYKNDILVIVLILFIALILLAVTGILKKDGHIVVVTIDSKVYGEYPLNKDMTTKLNVGNTLVIRENEVFVSESTCEDKVCINHGRISAVGETIICLPHKLVIEVKGDSDE